ncbi:MAG TPA: glucosaminidase domain-containing protein, partial [Chitinophagaceae bacterium]|nr:glucosaminidase domain-containing protein [Chitinophagaceae bacterium]
ANSFAQPPAAIKQYIEQYRDLAIEEMKRTGVPAAITLAQGIHETDAGRSQLVIKSNNHFGIKCKTGWKGESVSHDDDARGECFRKYNDPYDSYRDHSDFLKTRSHYAFLFDLDPTDYEGWCYGLKKAGYATNPKYSQILIKLIKEYGLQDYTLVALGRKEIFKDENSIAKAIVPEEKPEVITEKKEYNYPKGVFKINQTNVVFVTKGTSYLAIAEQYKVSLPRLFDFNDMVPAEEAENDRLVYLQRKRKEGAKEMHIVQPGETLYDIAQTEGIRLESLLSYNYLKEGVNPVPGRNLYLQSGSKKPVEQTITGMQQAVYTTSQPNAWELKSDSYKIHIVQLKETMYAIAKKYAVSVDAIKQWNDLQTNDLKKGQQLRINKNQDVTY